jgi:hypothetical protein
MQFFPASRKLTGFSAAVYPLKWHEAFFLQDLQILRSSLIIICLFGDAARFRCGNPCFDFVFL